MAEDFFVEARLHFYTHHDFYFLSHEKNALGGIILFFIVINLVVCKFLAITEVSNFYAK